MLAALYQISLKLSSALVTTRLSPTYGTVQCRHSWLHGFYESDYSQIEILWFGLYHLQHMYLDRWEKQTNKKTVVALICGLNMLEIQISDKRIESLWALQGVIRINSIIVMPLLGNQFPNKGESVPPLSLPHWLTCCSPPSATGWKQMSLTGCRPLNQYTLDFRTTRDQFLYKLSSLVHFAMATWKELKEEDMSFLELYESTRDQLYLYFFEVRWPYNPLPRRHSLVIILIQLAGIHILVTLCPPMPQIGIFQSSISDE